MTVIGGADGPTKIFIASETGWLNVFGLVIVLLILAPNIIHAIRHRSGENKCKNRIVNIAEQIGRYACMLLMIFNIGVAELGFSSPIAFLVYFAGNTVLLLAYYVFWFIYCKRQNMLTALMLAILPTVLFLLSGVTMRHWLLVGFAVLFGAAHIYISATNASQREVKNEQD